MRNPDRMPSPMTPEDKLTPERRKSWDVLKEMAEIGRGEAPKPAEDWDLIWVLSGFQIDIAEKFDGEGEVLFDKGDDTAPKHIAKKVNQSRERFETGIEVAKQVAALRLGKKVEDLTVEDVAASAPDVYWNGTNWQNDNLRQRIEQGLLGQYGFPAEKVIISSNLDIKHTGHQFEKLEDSVLEGRRKVVIVSDTYHLPRVRRYLGKQDSKLDAESVVLYPSEPRRILVGDALEEIRKVPGYIEKGILPPEPGFPQKQNEEGGE